MMPKEDAPKAFASPVGTPRTKSGATSQRLSGSCKRNRDERRHCVQSGYPTVETPDPYCTTTPFTRSALKVLPPLFLLSVPLTSALLSGLRIFPSFYLRAPTVNAPKKSFDLPRSKYFVPVFRWRGCPHHLPSRSKEDQVAQQRAFFKKKRALSISSLTNHGLCPTRNSLLLVNRNCKSPSKSSL